MYIIEKRSSGSVQDLETYVQDLETYVQDLETYVQDLETYVRVRANEHLCEMRPVYVKIDLPKRPEEETTKATCKRDQGTVRNRGLSQASLSKETCKRQKRPVYVKRAMQKTPRSRTSVRSWTSTFVK